MKINCYIALVAAALGCACNPLADTDDMDNNVQATRIAFSPEVVTLDNAGRNAEEDQGQSVIVTLNPKARKSMAWSAETDKTETWCTLTECSVTDADGVTHRGFRITATENTAYKRTATVTLTVADGTQEMLPGRADGVYPDAEVTVDPKQIEFNADEIVPVDVSFTTNMGDVYAVSRDEDADWISWEDLGGNVIRFTAAPWDDEEQPRTANVYITVGSEETSAATAKIPVTQLAKDLYCYVWGASLFDYDRFELARRMTKSEAGVYRFDAYFTAGNAPEIRINTVLARRLLPRLRACGRRADRHAQFGGGCGSRGACDRHRRHAYADHRPQCDDLHPVAYSDRQLHARRRGGRLPVEGVPDQGRRREDMDDPQPELERRSGDRRDETGVASGAGLFRLGDVGRLRSPGPLHRAQSRLRRRGERRIGQGRSGRHGPSRTSLYAR